MKPSPPLSPAAEALLAYIRQNDYVTFAEMPRVLSPFIPVKGEWAVEIQRVPNLILWTGMSKEWLDTLNELATADLLWRQPCAVLSYLVDGAALTLPLAKRVPPGGYKAPHWAPVCFRPREKVPAAEQRKYARTAGGKQTQKGATR